MYLNIYYFNRRDPELRKMERQVRELERLYQEQVEKGDADALQSCLFLNYMQGRVEERKLTTDEMRWGFREFMKGTVHEN